MAETENVVLSPEDVDKILVDYRTKRAEASKITVEFSGVNDIDVLVLLKIMSKKEQSVDDIAMAAELMLDGRIITFRLGDKVLFSCSYNRGNGNALHLMFKGKAYLYDILQETVYALMLKKLTPHLEGSN